MWWIIGIVAVLAVVVAIIAVARKGSSGNTGDLITCPHCNKSVREPARRRSGRGTIDLYEFPCEKCGKMIYVKAG